MLLQKKTKNCQRELSLFCSSATSTGFLLPPCILFPAPLRTTPNPLPTRRHHLDVLCLHGAIAGQKARTWPRRRASHISPSPPFASSSSSSPSAVAVAVVDVNLPLRFSTLSAAFPPHDHRGKRSGCRGVPAGLPGGLEGTTEEGARAREDQNWCCSFFFFRANSLTPSNTKKIKPKLFFQVLVVSNQDVAQLHTSLLSYQYCGMSSRRGGARTEKGRSGRAGGGKCRSFYFDLLLLLAQFSLLFFFLLLFCFQILRNQKNSHHGPYLRARLAGARLREGL